MTWLRFFRRAKWDEERARELEAHLQIEAEENIARGMAPEEASYAAKRKLGNQSRIREEIYRMNTIGFLETLWMDLRYGARSLRKSPGFTAVAVLTLALGIGANTAIFSIVDAVLLKTLPVANPQELVLFSDDPSQGSYSGHVMSGLWFVFTYHDYEFFRDHNESFREICAFESDRHTVRIRTLDANSPSGVEFAKGKVVSGNYFSVLGLQPAAGRLLSPGDDRPGAPAVAVMSYARWHRRYNNNASIVGRTLEINDSPFTIIGVAPPEFFGENMNIEDFWFPLIAHPQVAGHKPIFEDTGYYWLNMMGRLKPGVTMREAQVEVNLVLRRLLLAEAGPKPPPRYERALASSHIQLAPGALGISSLRSKYSQPLHVLLAVVGLVLLIACANVANLLLSRAASREREMSVRVAVGASRGRLVRQLLTEGVLLSSMGGLLGVLGAWWGAKFLFTIVAGNGYPVHISENSAVLGFTLLISVAAGIVFGLAPAIRATRHDLAASIKGSTNATGASRRRFGSANALVVFQVAMALPLLVGAGLFVRTLQNLLSEDLGFIEDHVLVAPMDPKSAGYTPDELKVLYPLLLDRISAIPGVLSAALDSTTPMGGNESATNISIQGASALQPSKDGSPSDEMGAHMVDVSARYFETVGIPILLGRDISAEDIQRNRRVCVINKTMAQKYFSGTNPIGRQYCSGSPFDPQRAFEIVGVAADARYYSIRDAVPPTAFNAPAQLDRDGYIVIRTAGDPARIEAVAPQVIASAAPRLRSTNVAPLRDQVQDRFKQDRTVAGLSSTFGGLALLLACIGLYGTMAYRVSRRTNEIGIRVALGAQPSRVLWLVMKECALLVAAGLAIGIPLTLASTRIVASQLFELSPMDPLTIALASVALAIVAAIAGFVPARRAMRVDPMVALRYE
jgi:predicted permease